MLARLIIGVITVYRYCISPLLGQRCRFFPSCSEYAQQAIARFGVITGCYLVIKRLLKCHPFHPGGIDEVPEQKDLRNGKF